MGRAGLFRLLLLGAIISVVYTTIAETQTPCGRPRCEPPKNSRRISHSRNTNSKELKPDPMATLTVETEPKSTITISGKDWFKSGSVNERGFFVAEVKPLEELNIVVSRPGFLDGHTSIKLEPSEARKTEVTLVPKDGTLTVAPDVPDAEIYVSGKGSYKNEISRLPVSAGTYSVNVSKFCYQSESTSVVIPPGEDVRVPIKLKLLPVDELLAVAEAQWQKKNYADAATAAKLVLTANPSHARANHLMGLIVMLTERASESTPYLLAALVGGEEITLPVSFHSDVYYPGNLILSVKGIEFRSSDQNGPAFIIRTNKIYSLETNAASRYRLRVLAGMPGSKKEEKKSFDFHASSGTTPSTKCSPCADELELLHSLIIRIIN